MKKSTSWESLSSLEHTGAGLFVQKPACMKDEQEIQPDAHAAAAEGQTTLVFFFKGWNLSVTISDIRYGVCFPLCNHFLIWTAGGRVTFRLVVMSSFIVISQTWKASVASSRLMLISVCAEMWWEMWLFCYVLPKCCPASQGLGGQADPRTTTAAFHITWMVRGVFVCVCEWQDKPAGSVWQCAAGLVRPGVVADGIQPRKDKELCHTAQTLQGWFEEHNHASVVSSQPPNSSNPNPEPAKLRTANWRFRCFKKLSM